MQGPSTSGLNAGNLNLDHCVGRAAVYSALLHLVELIDNYCLLLMFNFQPCSVLLDYGSQATVITDNCVQRLSLNQNHAKVKVWGISATNAGLTRGRVGIRSSSR